MYLDLKNPGSFPKMTSFFSAEGLTVAPVDSYANIESKMEEGTTNRTVAATQMNATSSRAHTIVGITLIQKFKNAAGEETTKSSIVNLVDLAGRSVFLGISWTVFECISYLELIQTEVQE